MSKRCLTFPALLLMLLVPVLGANEDHDPYRLVQIQITSDKQIPSLQLMGLDLVQFHDDFKVDAVVNNADLAELKAAGFLYEIKIQDMEAFYANRLKDSYVKTRAFPDGSMGGNYTLSEVEAILDNWAIQYPHLISPKISIGTSIQGRDIWAVKISDNPLIDENEPECCFDALIHAREPQSMMTLIWYMTRLLEDYGTDAELTYLVDNREIWFIPVFNPDGYYYNEQNSPNGGGMWRKNRRNNGGSYGVDLNRNYGFKWGYDNYGSSPNPGDETYRGTAAFSEPETTAVSNFSLLRPFVTSWNTHTYSDLYLCPFGYDSVYPYGNDWPIYQEYLDDISADNGYVTGPASMVLYSANGIATDWHYATAGQFNITPEIGGSGAGFWPSFNRILPLAEENFEPIKYWTWVAGSYVQLEGHTLADDNGDGLYFPGEPVGVTLTLRNKGLGDTMTTAIATITSASPYVTVLQGTHDFGVIPGYSEVNNSGSPLTVVLDSKTPYGETITLDVAIDFDNFTLTLPLSFIAGAPMIYFQDNFESDTGWTVTNQNISSGAWERDVPNPTSGGQVAPLEDNPSGTGTYCYLTENGPSGGSYSQYDIDGGPTILTSPVIDLSAGDAQVSLYAWYYSRDNDDPFMVDISNNNGTSWTNVLSTQNGLNGWELITFNVGDYVTPTANVKVRVSAQDQPNNDIVEAGLDDFEVKTFASPIDLSLSGPPIVGTTVNIHMSAPQAAGLEYRMAASRGTYPAYNLNGQYIPINIDNVTMISLNPGNGIFNNFQGNLDASGFTADPEFVIPNNPLYVGMDIFVIAVTVDASGFPQGVTSVSAPLPITIQ